MSWAVDDLAYLRWHWGGAYVINGDGEHWSAKRTDNGRTLTADSALGLLDAIRDDYAARPVPRPEPARLVRKYSG